MSLLNVLVWGDPVLRRKSLPMDPALINDEFRAWLVDFTETMYENDGIGLAAVQVGRLERILVVDTEWAEENAERAPKVFINPIIETVGPVGDYDEGCLSVPGVRGKVKRPEIINVSWLDEFGVAHRQENVDGLLARCLQHEMDHLEGVLFVDHLSPAARALSEGKLRRLAKRQG